MSSRDEYEMDDLDAEEIINRFDTSSRSKIHHEYREDIFRDDGVRYPHMTERQPSFTESVGKFFTGEAVAENPNFTIINQRTGAVQLSLFAHHETRFAHNGTWLSYFTLAQILLSLVIGVMATFVVTGIVTSYYNGVLWIIVGIVVGLLVIVHIAFIMLTWSRYSPFSHLYNNAVLFPVFYVGFAYFIVLLALGYWVSEYQDSFSGTYDPLTATAEATLYYYGTYTLIAVMCFSCLPDLVGSSVTQLYPERKTYLSDESAGTKQTYYVDSDGLGTTVNIDVLR